MVQTMIGAVLFVVVIVCLVALVVISRKRRELRDMMYYEAEAEKEEFIIPEPEKPVLIKGAKKPVYRDTMGAEKPSNQTTIYAYQRDYRTRICRQCDGENAITAECCCICGMPF